MEATIERNQSGAGKQPNVENYAKAIEIIREACSLEQPIKKSKYIKDNKLAAVSLEALLNLGWIKPVIKDAWEGTIYEWTLAGSHTNEELAAKWTHEIWRTAKAYRDERAKNPKPERQVEPEREREVGSFPLPLPANANVLHKARNIKMTSEGVFLDGKTPEELAEWYKNQPEQTERVDQDQPQRTDDPQWYKNYLEATSKRGLNSSVEESSSSFPPKQEPEPYIGPFTKPEPRLTVEERAEVLLFCMALVSDKMEDDRMKATMQIVQLSDLIRDRGNAVTVKELMTIVNTKSAE